MVKNARYLKGRSLNISSTGIFVETYEKVFEEQEMVRLVIKPDGPRKTFKLIARVVRFNSYLNQPRGYGPQDAPVYGDKRGPHCGQLPSPSYSQANPGTQPDFVDGVDEPTGKGTSRVAPGWSGTAAGFAGGREESALLKALLAPGLGVSGDDVPDLGVLLVGPMARGAEVSLR